MGKLSTYGSMSSADNLMTMADVEGQPLKVLGFNKGPGKFGEVYYLKCSTAEGEKITVMCGAFLIKEAIDEVAASDGFPVDATFTKKGKAWISS